MESILESLRTFLAMSGIYSPALSTKNHLLSSLLTKIVQILEIGSDWMVDLIFWKGNDLWSKFSCAQI